MITAESLEKFIEDNNTATVIKTLQEMSEEERDALRATAIRTAEIFRFRERLERPLPMPMDPQKKELEEQKAGDPPAHPYWQRAIEGYESAKVVMLYCCDYQELKAAGPNGLPSPNNALEVLRQRKPSWLDKWCTITLRSWPDEYWHTVFELEKLCKKKLKHTLDYYQALALGLPSYSDMEKYVEDSPSLIDEFYTFLASPTTIRAMAVPEAVIRNIDIGNGLRFISSSYRVVKDSEDRPKRWIECIATLVNRGKLDRSRLVTVSFQTLANAAEEQKKRTNSYIPDESTAPFLCALNDALCPDKSTYLRQYASLIGATNSDVSVYATNILLSATASSLPVDDILANIPMAFRNRDKAPASVALKLLSKLATVEGVSEESIGLAVIDSFTHRSKAIHKDAITMLGKGQVCMADSVQEKLLSTLDLLEGTNKSAAAKLLAKGHPAQTDNSLRTKPAHDSDQQSDQAPTLTAPDHLDQKYLTLAGIDTLCKAAGAPTAPSLVAAVLAPVDLRSMDVPRLYADQTVSPIETVDDLVFLVSSALTRIATSEDLELMLDGIARLWKVRDQNFEERTESLRQTLEQTNPLTNQSFGTGPMGLLANLWLAGERADATQIWFSNPTLTSRCHSLTDRMRAGLVLPMLAAPTHKGGWIEPLTLVRRLKAYQDNHRLMDRGGLFALPKLMKNMLQAFSRTDNAYSSDEAEFIQALLRLAPDGRMIALEEANSIRGEVGKALRYALSGGDLSTIDKPAYAIAAFRSRAPHGICQTLPNDFPQYNLPDVVYPAEYTFNSTAIFQFLRDHHRILSPTLPDFLNARANNQPVNPEENTKELNIAAGNFPGNKMDQQQLLDHLFPTALLHRNYRDYGFGDWSLDWLQNKEPLLARMAKRVLQHINSTASGWQNAFSLLFDPDFPLDENGSWLISLGLAAKLDDARRLALDVLIAAVDENRANAQTMGQTIPPLLKHKFTVIRWTKSFRELSRISPLHALFSWQLLVTVLAIMGEECPNGFLELMLELHEDYGFALPAEAIDALKSFTGSGKMVQIAKKLAVEAQTWKRLGPLYDAANQSFTARVSRVERWQETQYFGC